MPIEDADKVHSRRGKESATISIFGKKIDFMKLMTIVGVGTGGLFLLIAAVLMMTPQQIVNSTPIEPVPTIFIDTTKILFDVIQPNYNHRIIKMTYIGNKTSSDFKTDLLSSIYPPKSTHYVPRQSINSSAITSFNAQFDTIYLYTGTDNTFYLSYTVPNYDNCIDFINGDWTLHIDDNATKKNIYKFKFNITNSKTIVIENGTSINTSAMSASDYSTLLVYPGIYKERVSLFKPTRIIGIGGPVIDGGGVGSDITLHSSNNVITGMTIRNSGIKELLDGGIVIMPGSSKNNIIKNDIYRTMYGIWIYQSSENIISNNTIHDNDDTGIKLTGASSNIITSNILYNNINGIHADSLSKTNTIRENNVYDNKKFGIVIDNYKILNNICEYNIYKNNNMSCSDSIDRDQTPISRTIQTTQTTQNPDDWWSDCKDNPKCYQSK